MADVHRPSISIEDQDWVFGHRLAPVTLLEYGDFECPYCAAARPLLKGLVVDYPDLIRLVYRHFPVTTIHPHAFAAAEAAEAAGAQGKFWEMHDTLFTHQHELDFEHLRWYAEVLGLDTARFDEDMRAHTYGEEVRRDFRRGIEDGVNGTPTILIEGQRYDGPRTREAMLSAISAVAPHIEPVRPTGT